jgi:hypothetical protein
MGNIRLLLAAILFPDKDGFEYPQQEPADGR